MTGCHLLDSDRRTHARRPRPASGSRYVSPTRQDAGRRSVFGLAFHTESGVLVSGPNSEFGGIHSGRIYGPGHIDYAVDSLALTPAAYLVSAAITDITLLHVFDYRDAPSPSPSSPGKSPDRNGVCHPSTGPALAGRHRFPGGTESSQ